MNQQRMLQALITAVITNDKKEIKKLNKYKYVQTVRSLPLLSKSEPMKEMLLFNIYSYNTTTKSYVIT